MPGEDTDTTRQKSPAPSQTPSKMHQSSHRILRWTQDDRPYTKDFQDLFCTLMVAIPLKMHRVRLQKRYHSFTTGEAIAHLGNLRFIQSNRRPSPNDPNVTVTTKIATTFSMVPHMARYLCNQFLAARLIESVEGKNEFLAADSVWQLTPKGICLLQSFAHRNGVHVQHVYDVLDSPRNTMHLLFLERESETDQLNHDRGTMEVVFRRFAGLEGPNVRTGSSGSDSDSISESPNGVLGVHLSKERRVGSKIYHNTFSGRGAVEWLMNCCTLVDEREAYEVASLFIDYGFIELVNEEKHSPSREGKFNPSKSAIYKITEEGKEAAKWISRRRDAGNAVDITKSPGAGRDSNTSRMVWILATPSLRLLFREFLRDTHCEENLLFYQEVKEFLARWQAMLKRTSGKPTLDMTRETLAAAYDLYNAFLAPGSPCELNIDHSLRNALVGRMTRFELPDNELFSTVGEVISLYDQAQTSVFKLMASDSVPKFLRDPKYEQALYENHIDTSAVNGKKTPAVLSPA